MQPNYQDFLTQELPEKLRTLPADRNPNFGMMTAHHMVEHLIYVTKTMMKRHGEPSGEPNKSQLFFRGFIDRGAPFEYRPRPDATLNDLRTESIEAAIQILEGAITKFYGLYATPDYKSYSDQMGEFNLEELELF